MRMREETSSQHWWPHSLTPKLCDKSHKVFGTKGGGLMDFLSQSKALKHEKFKGHGLNLLLKYVLLL
jgi:hypothetical protein